ncbi:CLUMA_CG002727, isoform A [Clunio marinus]|uniref:CLUMA_CG002727, isoform A n=1 Tax=Clunio marinus TaxID=568069 RepID=A0A1J1HLG4_9DIPT|nr:CLUMA_CG002727, isoform A [Clunio marinus]
MCNKAINSYLNLLRMFENRANYLFKTNESKYFCETEREPKGKAEETLVRIRHQTKFFMLCNDLVFKKSRLSIIALNNICEYEKPRQQTKREK